MTSGLERVARALCESDANPPDATMDGKPLWQDYLPEACAAIMAIREPDLAMISAAALEVGQIGKNDVGRIYRAMIGAAMIQQPPTASEAVGISRTGRLLSGRFRDADLNKQTFGCVSS